MARGQTIGFVSGPTGFLMAFYTARSERLFCEQLDYNLLFRWFLNMDKVE